MEIAQAFDHAAFHSLSSLYDANRAFQANDGLAFVESKLKSLILRHKVSSLFGVALLHRHFDMEKDTILVEKQGVSTPWQYTSDMAKHGGKIVPNSWFVDNGRCLPYEFSFVPFTKPEPPELSTYASFATEYFQLVEAAGLQDLVGLRRLFGDEGTGMLECTEGKANIMFSSDEVR